MTKNEVETSDQENSSSVATVATTSQVEPDSSKSEGATDNTDKPTRAATAENNDYTDEDDFVESEKEKKLEALHPVDFVTYGIGRFSSNAQAQLQFALLLLMIEKIKMVGKIWMYDPVLNELEKEVNILLRKQCVVESLCKHAK